jgi:hypothetical protein
MRNAQFVMRNSLCVIRHPSSVIGFKSVLSLSGAHALLTITSSILRDNNYELRITNYFSATGATQEGSSLRGLLTMVLTG